MPLAGKTYVFSAFMLLYYLINDLFLISSRPDEMLGSHITQNFDGRKARLASFLQLSGAEIITNLSARIVAIGYLVFNNSTTIAAPFSTIQVPPISAIASLSNEETLHQLVLTSLIAGNCDYPDLTKGDAGLPSGTAQNVAENMQVSTDQYFASYLQPAMAKLTAPNGCNEYFETTQIMLEKVKELGGRIIHEDGGNG